MWVEQCFQIHRPDLAWLIYLQLKKTDPDNPNVFLLPARFGDEWFSFRRKFLGLSAELQDEVIDLSPDTYQYLVRSPSPWKKTWKDIPLGDKLSVGPEHDLEAVQKMEQSCLGLALAEFETRENAGTLSVDMKYRYAAALELAGKTDRAAAMLDSIVAQFPGEAKNVMLSKSGLYARDGNWQAVYETLREWSAKPDAPLTAMLAFCDAQFRLRLGVCALETNRRMLARFPESDRAIALRISLADKFLSAEEELSFIERIRNRLYATQVAEIELLRKTQRFAAARAYEGVFGISSQSSTGDTTQALSLPNAESSLNWYKTVIPAKAQFEENAKILEQNLPKATSPFLSRVIKLWLDCWRSDCAVADADPDRWAACGRDGMEQAAALNQLTLLLCGRGRNALALEPARRAAESMPGSAILWRAYIGVSSGDPDVVEKAFIACPDDPEIWLARIVVWASGGKTETQLLNEIHRACEAKIYPAGTMVRAGAFLLEKGMVKAASVAAADAESRGRGLLPAHILALRCATEASDSQWALSASIKAIENSVNPPAWLCGKMVELCSKSRKPLPEAIFVLSKLRSMDFKNPLWMDLLGRARFFAGGPDLIDAKDQFRQAMAAGVTNRTVVIFLAETERLRGDNTASVETLRNGLRLFPDDPVLINNLAYCLAEKRQTAAEALTLVPVLLRTQWKDMEMMDTAQFVNIQNGRLDIAEKLVFEELKTVYEGGEAWAKACLRLAQIRLLEKKPEMAHKILSDISGRDLSSMPSDFLLELGRMKNEAEATMLDMEL